MRLAVAMNRTWRQVDRHVEVVVDERLVLLGVEHLEQGARGVAAEVVADLVELVEHEHGVAGAGADQRADDAPGERADVGAAVATDLGLVLDAAERDADELRPVARGDGGAEAGLADAGGPDEAQDGALGVGAELADGEELEDRAP
jgi:hypothetical protein